jgi:hypothetical protein
LSTTHPPVQQPLAATTEDLSDAGADEVSQREAAPVFNSVVIGADPGLLWSTFESLSRPWRAEIKYITQREETTFTCAWLTGTAKAANDQVEFICNLACTNKATERLHYQVRLLALADLLLLVTGTDESARNASRLQLEAIGPGGRAASVLVVAVHDAKQAKPTPQEICSWYPGLDRYQFSGVAVEQGSSLNELELARMIFSVARNGLSSRAKLASPTKPTTVEAKPGATADSGESMEERRRPRPQRELDTGSYTADTQADPDLVSNGFESKSIATSHSIDEGPDLVATSPTEPGGKRRTDRWRAAFGL